MIGLFYANSLTQKKGAPVVVWLLVGTMCCIEVWIVLRDALAEFSYTGNGQWLMTKGLPLWGYSLT